MAQPVRYLLTKLLGASSFKRRIWSRWYRYLEKTVGDQPIYFLNYGYCPENGVAVRLEPQDEPNRTSIQLYEVVTRSADLAGRDVLEVSSGRGGGARWIHANRKPARMVGVDRTEKAVAFCRRQHGGDGLHFLCGDAQQLPFAAGSFDAVINVEASHCYPRPAVFFREVHRVLRTGGRFLHADLRRANAVEEWQGGLQGAGLRTLEEEEITPNVVRALDQSTERMTQLIDKLAPRMTRPLFARFAGTRGSAVYRLLKSGQMRYLRFVLVKE